MKPDQINLGEWYETTIPGTDDKFVGKCIKVGGSNDRLRRTRVTLWRRFTDPKYPGVGLTVTAKHVIRKVKALS